MKSYCISSAVISERFESEAIVLHLPTSTYYRLDEAAAEVFDRIQSGATDGELSRQLATEFDVSEPTALSDVRALLEQLAALGLVEECADASSR